VPQTRLLVRTLCAAPELGKHFHYLSLENAEETLAIENVSKAIATVRGLSIPDMDRWARAITANSRDAVMAILVCLMPNIEVIDMDPDVGHDRCPLHMYLEPILSAAKETPYSSVYSHSRLSQVRIRMCSIHSHKTSALFRLQALLSLELFGTNADSWEERNEKSRKACEESEGIYRKWGCSPRSSKLKCFAIHGVFFSVVVEVMLGSIASLESFTCWTDFDFDIEPNWLRQVGTALLQHQSSMKELDLTDMCHKYDTDDRFWVNPSPLCGGLSMLRSVSSLVSYEGHLLPFLSSKQLDGNE
jgi:hypothetical protein